MTLSELWHMPLSEVFKRAEAKVGQKGMWAILSIVVMLVVIKVCF